MDAIAALLSVAVGVAIARAAGLGADAMPWAFLAAPALLASFIVHGVYRGSGLRLVPTGVAVVASVVRSLPVAALGVIGLLAGVGAGLSLPHELALAACVLLSAVVTVPLIRSTSRQLGGRVGAIGKRRVLVVGAGEAGDHVLQRLQRQGAVTVLGMVDDDPLPGFETVGSLADLPSLCRDLQVDGLIIALPRAPWITVSEIIRPLLGSVDIAIVPSLYELITWRSGTADLAGMPLVPLAAAQRNAGARFVKRAIDIVGGSLALVVCAPILLVAAAAIRLDTPGPAVFRQQRAGIHGKHFSIWKFRTMVQNAEAMRDELMEQSDADGPRFKMTNDPRVTRVGRWLRRFSIDELPQLFNVVGGSMSLVGPRPFPVAEFGALSQGPAVARFDMPPGMTGLWQVSGRSDLSWDDLCRLDSVYVGSWSLLWDLRILLQTPAAVFRRVGAY